MRTVTAAAADGSLGTPDDGAGWLFVHVLARFYLLLDASQFRAAADLFAADGTWRRQGVLLAGPDDIFAALEARSRTLLTRHVMCAVVSPIGEGVRVNSYITTYSHDDGAAPSLPASVLSAHAVMDGEATLATRDGRIAIQSLEHRMVFRFAQAEV